MHAGRIFSYDSVEYNGLTMIVLYQRAESRCLDSKSKARSLPVGAEGEEWQRSWLGKKEKEANSAIVFGEERVAPSCGGRVSVTREAKKGPTE